MNDLDKQYGPAKIDFSMVKIGTVEGDKDMKAAGLTIHGIVARNAEGELIKSIEGHNYGKFKVEKAVKTLMKQD